jgi:S1-C subfamily serine protease
MLKNIFKLTIVFIFGILGGVFANQVFWPRDNSSPAVETKEITIEENIAFQDAVEKIKKSVVAIKTETKEGKTITGSGLIATNDGLIVTLSEIVPKKGNFVFFVDGQTPNWQILKRDEENNLALIKVEQGNLSTVAFADFDQVRLGQRVFLLGIIFEKNGRLETVNEGVIKFFSSNYIRTNIFEKNILNGSALFNIKGELLGLNTIDSEGKVTAIPITKIRAFLGR